MFSVSVVLLKIHSKTFVIMSPQYTRQDDYNESAGGVDGDDPIQLVKISSVNIAPFHVYPGTHRKLMLPQHEPPPPLETSPQRRQFSNPISYLGGPKLDASQKKVRNKTSIESILSLD